jgi:UDP-N-acetylglucosamine 2-epimerase (hydrolysing)
MDDASKVRDGRRKVLFLTGTRADFGKLEPLMRVVEDAPEFSMQIFATGMHLLSRYGSTWREIANAGFKNVYRYVNQVDGGGAQLDLVVGSTIQGLGFFVREFRPDLLVVHGDRVEALAGAIVGAMNNILVGHIEGGEVSGTIDETIRHAVSKLSHLHFVANQEARDRLLRMGEDPAAVQVIGSPDIDVMLSDRLPSLDEAKRRYEIGFDEYLIFMYHPVTTEEDEDGARVRTVLNAVAESGIPVVAIYPNNDPGSESILRELRQFETHPSFRVLPSLRFEHFLVLLRNAKAIVGNSSAGVREAPVYGTPTVNVGTRQARRFSHESIIDAPEEHSAIANALRSISRRYEPTLHFGDGHSAIRFLEQLRRESLWRTECQKQFRDV